MRNGNIAVGIGLFVVALLAATGKLQQLWTAIMKAEMPMQNVGSATVDTSTLSPTSSPAGGGGAPSSSPPTNPIIGAAAPKGAQNVIIPTSGAATLAAIPTGLAHTVAQYGSDLYNWCLAFVSNVRSAAGNWSPVYGAPTAAAACSQLSLRKGLAPPGATVCFAPTSTNPAGHIGIANGGDSYTSAGIIHGGLSTGPYVSNPQYLGYAL
jgi:hypothetical protein